MDGTSTFFFVLLGFGLGIFLWQRRKAALQTKLETFEVPVMLPVKHETTCAFHGEPHTWESHSAVDAFTKEKSEKMICMKCGVISGSEKQFSPDGLQKLKRQIERMKAEMKLREEFELLRIQETEALYLEFLMTSSPMPGQDALKAAFLAGQDSSGEATVRAMKKLAARQAERLTEVVQGIPGIKRED